ncbi:MAG: NADH-quinone oxidoreductase subunit NuoE, partial [Thermotoga sp.]
MVVETLAEEKYTRLDEYIEEIKGKKGMLIMVLHKAQEIFGYLPAEVQMHVAERLHVPLSDVYGVVTFYSFFTMTPKGRHKIKVCMGTACYVKGGSILLDALQNKLRIKVGGVTKDRRFSLNAVRCLGACSMAPVIMIDNTVYGKLTENKLDEILEKYK